ncbi:GNAT family N-acetyltransferase [Streptomyces niger]|uniref:GNAT family N-acetyltransferase n=1 Tax=Streptomyces niger TaxID=66373 RepID=UPI00069C6D14|nr:GNAT family N-acetyltransferase [Streptomyces niger]
MATNYGFSSAKAMALSLFVAKIHGLAVAEVARGQGIAAALLKRTWQVHQQLGYFLLYGAYEADRRLDGFYDRCGYTVLAPVESFSLDRIALPFGLTAGESECMFTRWRPATDPSPSPPLPPKTVPILTRPGGPMPQYNKRLDPVGDDGLTRTRQAVARRWGTVLRELPRLAEAVEKEDFETIAERGEQLAHVLDYLSREARTADRAPIADKGAVFGAVDPDALTSPVGQALHGR